MSFAKTSSPFNCPGCNLPVTGGDEMTDTLSEGIKEYNTKYMCGSTYFRGKFDQSRECLFYQNALFGHKNTVPYDRFIGKNPITQLKEQQMEGSKLFAISLISALLAMALASAFAFFDVGPLRTLTVFTFAFSCSCLLLIFIEFSNMDVKDEDNK